MYVLNDVLFGIVIGLSICFLMIAYTTVKKYKYDEREGYRCRY